MRSAIRAATRLAVDGPRVWWAHEWPVVLRPTGAGRVHLVHAAGGPLGGDDLALTVDVGHGASLAVHSAGATLVQPGAATAAPARWTVDVRVGAGGHLHWAPEPTVVSDGAALESAMRVTLAPGALATVRETVVLGRHGQRGGRCTGATNVVVDGLALLAHTTVLDGADLALSGPAGTSGARAVGTLVCAGAVPLPAVERGEAEGVRWAWTPLDGPGAVLLAVGRPAAVTAVLDASVPSAGVQATPVPEVAVPAAPGIEAAALPAVGVVAPTASGAGAA